MGNMEPRPIASLTSALIKRGKKALDSVTARGPEPAPPMAVPESAAPEPAAPEMTAPELAATPMPAPELAAPAPEPAAAMSVAVMDEPAADAGPDSDIAGIAAVAASGASGTDVLTDDDFDVELEMASISPEGITSAAARRAARRPRRDRRYRFLEDTPPEFLAAPHRPPVATAAVEPTPSGPSPAGGDLPPARPTGAGREPTQSEIDEQVAAIRREYATRMGAHGGSGPTTIGAAAADAEPPPARAGSSLRDAFLFLAIFAAGVAVILFFLNAPL